MPRLAANLTTLFTEVDFLNRFAGAARAGFAGVEYRFPYEFPVKAIRRELEAHGLVQVLFDLPAGDWGRGERGIACHPGRVEEFRAGVEQAVAYAEALGARRVNCLAGIRPAEVDEASAERTLVDNLRHAAGRLEAVGVELVMEMVNSRDVPGFFLTGTPQALALRERVGHANLRLQYDCYHMQIMEGDLARTLERHLSQVGHIQLADNPGRHEPGTGEINYRFLLEHLDRLGYDGWVGCEYLPATSTEAGLGWLKTHGMPALA
ncbi:hydroxypyruvate isomerase [Stutzerimonas azotifigens]|uniref:hydroxypyruvate isomerase n=1 Tax=Stutzerimonas azotifigens TaxID=291995 RepID=UPI0003FFB71A|nr:hydroxypyruvate isomerase [Stutzerimonas azotifigens]